MVRRTVCVIVALGLVMLSLGCATSGGPQVFVQDSYRTLAASKASYETAMTVAGRVSLSESERNAIIKHGRAYAEAHNAAVEALARYREIGNVSQANLYAAQIALASEFLSKILRVIEPYLLELAEEDENGSR